MVVCACVPHLERAEVGGLTEFEASCANYTASPSQSGLHGKALPEKGGETSAAGWSEEEGSPPACIPSLQWISCCRQTVLKFHNFLVHRLT